MIDKNETLTFTFLFRDEEEKVILINRGEIPAKDESEADQVLSSSNPEDLDAIDKIVSKITVFRDAEPGSEPSVTETLDDLYNKYGISIEELEEETGKDLDSDHDESEESSSHEEAIEHHREDRMEDEKEADGEYSLEILTDPTAILPERKEWYTSPSAFLDEEEVYEDDSYTSPEIIVESEEMFDEAMKELGDCSGKDCKKKASVLATVHGKKTKLCDDCYKAAKKSSPKDVAITPLDEGASPAEAIAAFVHEIEPGKRMYSAQVHDIFVNKLAITDIRAQEAILRKLPATGNVEITKDENGTPCLIRVQGGSGGTNVRLDNAVVWQLLGHNEIDPGVVKAAQGMQRPKWLRNTD